MATKEYRTRVIVTACSLAIAAMGGLATAQTSAPPGVTTGNEAVTQADVRDAAQQVSEAARVVRQMEQDEGMAQLLQQAEGVFILADYGRAALGLGGRGGEGVLLVKQNGEWSDPAFYNLGGVSAGVEVGIETGNIAFVLNNEKAVNSFRQQNNWSLNADAGLTIVAWSARGQAAAGKGDVVAWSDTEGVFGDLAISVTDINFDEDETSAYYGKQVALSDIINGKVTSPQSEPLKQALASASQPMTSGAGTTGGATGTTSGGEATVDPVEPTPGGSTGY